MRVRLGRGPALRKSRPPLGSLVVSAAAHVAAVAVLVLIATVFPNTPSKTYVVNLVPAVAAIGRPTGRTTAPAAKLPDLPKPELPRREARASASPELPPAREPELPRLPERTLPPRAAALPKAGDKELPPVGADRPKAPAPPPAVASPSPRRESGPPPQPIGQPTGSPVGVGALSLNVSDFPFAWYLRTVQQKISANWTPPGQSVDGQQVVTVFEITRDGQIRRPAIEKTSGNVLYDQAALRAIVASNPLPPLPTDFKEPLLRIHLGFNFAGDRG